MNKKLTVVALSIALLVIAGFEHSATAQRPAIVNKAELIETNRSAGMTIDDMVRPSNMALADLTVKEMCFESSGGFESVNVLVGNIGSVDAGTFELGFNYISGGGSERFARNTINGLKAGEEIWVREAHYCCGIVPTMFLVNTSVRFDAIADPRYFRNGVLPTEVQKVPAVIPESNESNNRMSKNKAELPACQVLKRMTTPNVRRPTTPVIKN